MTIHRSKVILAAAAIFVALGGAGYVLYSAHAQSAPPELAQSPLNTTRTIKPAFIMAVDDSGSMTFQNQFPAADGYACWSRSDRSFFVAPGVLRTSDGDSCLYAYSYTGPRINSSYLGIPPIDDYGFARSSDFNPSYFDPTVLYQPWMKGDRTSYDPASLTATRIDPRETDTLDLASWVSDADSRSLFRAYRDMRLPAGTRYRLTGGNNTSCGGLSNSSSGWREIGGTGHTMSGSCSLYIRYWPATFYLKYSGSSDPYPQLAGAPDAYDSLARERIRNACGSGCDLWRYRIEPSDTVALQNFANWFSFYGNRNRAMIAGMTRSMAAVEKMRVGYFTINGDYDDVIMQDMGEPEDREALYSDMIALPAVGGTPNLGAVDHMGKQFQRDPLKDPGAPVQLECQKNAGMLFTDGFSNVSFDASSVTGLGDPFDPTPADSMAAIASKYYFNSNGDRNTVGNAPDVPGTSPLVAHSADFPRGQVPVPEECETLDENSVAWKRLDCQTNLHMNFYGVTLGGRGDIFDPDIEQDPYVLNPSWPGYAGNTRSTIDDIWHATVNTRGEFINAKTPADITSAMRRVLAAIGDGTSPSGSIALTGARIGEGSLAVEPSYTARKPDPQAPAMDWYGDVTARYISSDPLDGFSTTIAWRASDALPAHGARNIYYGQTGSSVIPNVESFSGGLSGMDLEDLCDNDLAPGSCQSALGELGVSLGEAVDYLRGSQVLEGSKLRERTQVLGDIVNSSPVLVSKSDDYGYRVLTGTRAESYQAYLEQKEAVGHPPMVYVGANDGMFHAFHGDTGAETFAYIPATAVGHLGNLLIPYDPASGVDQVFAHRYYVDGAIAVSDVCNSTCTAVDDWRTVLVGAAGAGGRGVFALDITDPGNIQVLWEVNDLIDGQPDISENMGYVLGNPVIVPVNDADGVRWKAIFGNGYNSASLTAALFVVDVESGEAEVITASEGDSALAYNGLGALIAIDRNRRNAGDSSSILNGPDGYADTVYAADQNGAIWKFDLNTYTVSLGGDPLFVARSGDGLGAPRQTVTGGLEAAAGPGGSVMVYFGTGSFIFENDSVGSAQQSLYAILDRGDPVASRSLLLQQSPGDVTGQFRETTTLSISGSHHGWFMDLPTGQRFVGNPRVESGVIFFPVYQPPSEDENTCGVGGANWLYGLNALSGAAAFTNVSIGSPDGPSPDSTAGAIALDTGGTAPVTDVAVITGRRLAPGDITDPADLDDALEARCTMAVQVAGAPMLYLPRPCGRQSWRQVR